jgi:hypothetical protein
VIASRSLEINRFQEKGVEAQEMKREINCGQTLINSVATGHGSQKTWIRETFRLL